MLCGINHGYSKEDERLDNLKSTRVTRSSRFSRKAGSMVNDYPFRNNIAKWFGLWGFPLERDEAGAVAYGKCIGLALTLLLAVAPSFAGECGTPVGRDFTPGNLAESKLSSREILALNEEIDRAGYDVRGLLILRDCKLVFERYKEGVGRDHAHALYSVTKSITGTLVGRLLQEGAIKGLDVSLSSLIKRPLGVADPDWRKLETIQLEHAMRLRSGLQWVHDVKVGNPVHSYGADMLRDGMRLPMAAKPGEKFNYSDFDGALVGFAISDLTEKALPDAAQSLLFDQMAIAPSGWDFRDRLGRYSGGFGARLRPMDMLKIGQLYLQQGRWNGKQLIPSEFVQMAMPLAGEHRGEFGLMWWSGKNADLGDSRFFFANGRKAQRIYVFPAWNMVVAVVAALSAEDEQQMLRPLIRALKAAVDGGGSESSDDAVKLQQIKGFSGQRSFAEGIDTPRLLRR